MVHKLYQVLEEYNPKIHNVSLTKQQTKYIKLFKKGDMIKPSTMIDENMEYFATDASNQPHSTSNYAVFSTLSNCKQ